ncbi:MAG: L-sorbose 1-phosphate reductase [Clostridiales bacterium]|nr:MAG: L-sorbose 1-phosphate reductase [Clostridiales bacterium]
MKTTAVRLYGKEDLRLESFDLPEIKDDEILIKIVSDSICMSSYKAAKQGTDHKRVPDDVAENPIIIGHEFCGDIVKVGARWQDEWKVGEKFSIQPAINLNGTLWAPGYSYEQLGGSATYAIVPSEFMEEKCLLKYGGDAYFYGSLSEPMSCIVGAFHANYHTEAGSYVHQMEIKAGGNLAILAGAGPMGLGAVDYAIHAPIKAARVVVTDINQTRLDRAASIITPEMAAQEGVELIYMNTGEGDGVKKMMDLTDGHGYDDVFVFAPVQPVVEMGDKLLAKDGCLNFFAGPTDPTFAAQFNFYNVHYGATHVVGTSGGNTADMIESLALMEKGRLNPASMITHVGGLDSVPQTVLNLPKIPGGKKLSYTHLSLPMTAIDDFAELGKDNPLFAELDKIVKRHNGLWNLEAEQYLLANGPKIGE